MEIVFVLIVVLICGGLGSAVSHESKKGLGFVLGLLLGPIGVLIAAVGLRKE